MTFSITDFTTELPPYLAERTRVVGPAAGPRPGDFVLYWLHHAMRAEENAALDVAAVLARRLRLPLLVYQAIPERYPYASDRHHTFMLEGARDLQWQFGERDISYVVHVEQGGQRQPHLRDLTSRAAAVITEDMPIDPLRTWTERLAMLTGTATLAVDTACVTPMQAVGRSYERAYQFRQATRAQYEQRLERPWAEAEPAAASAKPDLAMEPRDLSAASLAELVSKCEIDHTIGPVPHTRGGSAAGYARWDAFKQSLLAAYARRRNDPLADGTSRLSPYLHYGMVSPLRIAREAARAGGPGAEKFLDELLIWRELAYAFCFYRRTHDSLAALPGWARKTLDEHQADQRPAILSWESLARARTGDVLWDAAQRSLLVHGELHNNVRMTWGKALLQWTPDPAAALAALIDLNHRYALDGRDPASYGGILWCLGQFDRPFPPERPIAGTVRERATADHAQRLDVERYRQHTSRPLHRRRPRAAVVGAGISGLMCARTLMDHGLDVTVFEKARGAGGRMATRRTTEGFRLDHGAQYFTVRDERFARYVDSWRQDGIVAPWLGRICTLADGQWQWKERTTPRFVGVPGMSAVCRHLAADLNVQFGAEVAPPERDGACWHIEDVRGRGLGKFEYVITSAPAPQSAALLSAAPQLQSHAASAEMQGCWAAMLSFDDPLPLPLDGAFVEQSPLSWIARNSSKPARGEGESWVLHASATWTGHHLEQAPEEVLPHLEAAFWQATGVDSRTPRFAASHRWRYAIPPQPLSSRCLFDPRQRIGACGDWCSGPRVEGAFLSGMAAAGRVLTHAACGTSD